MDRQKRAVYEWEDLFRSFGERGASRADIASLIRRACRRYGVEPPMVRFVSKAKSPSLTVTTYYDSSDHSISMGYRSCNYAIACHESAHAIIDDRYEDVEDHGPEFLGVYFDLLAWSKVAPRTALEASARALGLRWKIPRRKA